jgi:lipopolysaccharide transport system permease protein
MIMSWNPLTGIFECFRYAFLGAGDFTPSMLVYGAIVIFAILIAGTLIFNKIEKSFTDTI